jgi:hypothetical protein
LCVFCPIWVLAGGMATPLASLLRGVHTHPGQPPWCNLGRFIVTYVTLLIRVSFLPIMSLTPQSLSLLPFSFLYPFPFLGSTCLRQGLFFALISNFKRLLTPESLAFSSFFPCWQARQKYVLTVIHEPPVFSPFHFKQEATDRCCSLTWVSGLMRSSPASFPLPFLLPFSAIQRGGLLLSPVHALQDGGGVFTQIQQSPAV